MTRTRRIAVKDTSEQQYIGPAEFARIFGFCRVHVFNLIKRGVIKAVKIGNRWRIPKSELERILAETERRFE